MKIITELSVSSQQFIEMGHALGLNYRSKPYRNKFYCHTNDVNWNELVSKGYAIKLKGWDEDSAYFKLTYEAAKSVYGKRMSKKYFDEL